MASNDIKNWINLNIKDLSHANGIITITNVPVDLFNSKQHPQILNTIENIISLTHSKVSSLILFDIYFTNNDQFPLSLSYYQIILTYIYSLYSSQLSFNQHILIRFPQLMSAKPISDINTTLKIQYDITNHNLSITNETNTNSFSFLSTKATYPPMLDNIINSPNLIENNIKIFSYKRICFAGSFDHFHNGHNILLQLSLMLSQNEIFIGVTSDEMIKHKGKECVLQNVEYRSEMISNIIDLNGKSNSAEISIITIYDPISFAGIDQDLEVLVLTNETFKGGELVNNTRKQNQIKEVELIAINVIDYCGNIENNNPQTKISSSIIRKELIEKINLDILEFLYNKWNELNKNVFIQSDKDKVRVISLKWWNIIRDEYMKKWKWYHNLNHVYYCLNKYYQTLNDISSGLNKENEFEYAIWFHDIVYSPSRNDNESKSIDKFISFYEDISSFPESKTINKDKIINYISETSCHLANINDNNISNLYFLDIDVSIISDSDLYMEYENQIHKEYTLVYNEDEYKKGRKHFLEHLLQKEKIFRTKHYFDLYETKARNNLNSIIQFLN